MKRLASFMYLDVCSTPGEHVVVLDQLTQLWEMPAVPFTNSHSERVEVFVELVQQADALDDHVVRPCGVHLHLLGSPHIRVSASAIREIEW